MKKEENIKTDEKSISQVAFLTSLLTACEGAKEHIVKSYISDNIVKTLKSAIVEIIAQI